jgi:hypothetical protein
MAAQERILIESETKKLLLQEALFTTTMIKARPPKRKEEYVPPNRIEEFHEEILEAGRHLAVVSSPRFPDTERVSNAIEKVLTVVKDYTLIGMWVTSQVSNTDKEYATTKVIFEVSLCIFSLSINAMCNFELSAFLQITLNVVIDCVGKSNKCFETDSDSWSEVNDNSLKLLSLLDLNHYRNEFPKEKNLQDEWEAAVTNPG